MLINVFPVKRIYDSRKGKKIFNPEKDNNDYVIVGGILPDEFYSYVTGSGTYLIKSKSPSDIEDFLFPKTKGVPRGFDVGFSDQNTTLPKMVELDNMFYEPLLLKFRGITSNSSGNGLEGVMDTFEKLTSVDLGFFQKLELHGSNLKPKCSCRTYVQNSLDSYNALIKNKQLIPEEVPPEEHYMNKASFTRFGTGY